MAELSGKQLRYEHDVQEHKHEGRGQPYHHRPDVLPLRFMPISGASYDLAYGVAIEHLNCDDVSNC